MIITPATLRAIMPGASTKAVELYAPFLDATARAWGIDTPKRVAAWLPQLAHESGQLQYAREIWGPTAQQRLYERDPAAAWRAGLTKLDRNRVAYSLGNTQPGDGARFKGRGLIQVTGRGNYAAASVEMFGGADTLIERPEMLEQPELAAHSAGWFWAAHDLNALADAGQFDAITHKINGGTNGAAERRLFWGRAKKALGVG